MNDQTVWHDDDDFWTSFQPYVLEESGFKDIQTFADLSGSPYDNQASRLVAAAKK